MFSGFSSEKNCLKFSLEQKENGFLICFAFAARYNDRGCGSSVGVMLSSEFSVT